MAKNGKHGYLSHFGTMRHRPARPDLASGRRGRGFESRRLDYLAGATPEIFYGSPGFFFCSEVTCRHGSLDESTKNSYFAFLSVFLAYGSTKSNFDCFPVESFARTVPTKFAIVSFLVKDCA